jgi:hypothetical protein
MQCSPASSHFLHLRSKYSPQRPVLKSLQCMFFPKCDRSRRKLLASGLFSDMGLGHSDIFTFISPMSCFHLYEQQSVKVAFIHQFQIKKLRFVKFHISLHTDRRYEGVSKSFRTGRLERELQMVQLSATRCSYVTILWVSLVSFAAISLCVASQRVFIVVSIYISLSTESWNFWIRPRVSLFHIAHRNRWQVTA